MHESARNGGVAFAKGTGNDERDGEDGGDDVVVQGLERLLGGKTLSATDLAVRGRVGKVGSVGVLAAEFAESGAGAETFGDGREMINGLIGTHHAECTESLEGGSSPGAKCTTFFGSVLIFCSHKKN